MTDPTGEDERSPLAEHLRQLGPPDDTGLSREIGLRRVLAVLGIEDEVRIGRFIVRSTLGRGGMGTVFRASDPDLQRDVALKVLDRRVDAAHADAMRREARALARLAHPQVVAVYELGMEGDQAYVAMELVPGCTVREHAARDPRPSWQELVGIFVQAGQGLQAAHDAGLIHRDIKPDNLLVREDGRVLVADFGLARGVGADGEREIAGTLHYLAPEVLRRGESSVWSDQYAFCASLWRLLDPDAALGADGARMPIAVRAALQRGLADDPSARWPSIRALTAVLHDAVTAGPGAHHRGVLLQRVERLWISGVLRAALDGTVPLALPLTDAAGSVAPPWGTLTPAAPPTHADGPGLRAMLEAGHGSLLILGEPGAGKTTAMLRLAEVLLDEARADPAAPAPVVLHLASLGGQVRELGDWVEQELVSKYNLPRPNVRPWLEAGAIALLLDGLDEVPPDRRARCVRLIDALRARYGLTLVVTCRSSDYGAVGEVLAFGRAVTIDPVPDDVLHARLGGLVGATPAGPDLDRGLRTPLMLRLVESARERPPEGGDLLPWLYRRYLHHAFARRGVSAARQAAILDGLGYLAAAMTRAGRSELWLEQLEPDWVFHDRRRAATRLLGVALLVASCLAVNVSIGLAVDGDAGSGVMFGLLSAPMVLAFNGGLQIRPVERLRYSWRRLLRVLPLGLGLGVVAGGIYGLLYIPWVNVVFGAVAGVVTACTVAFEPAYQENGIRPNQGIWQSWVNGVGVGALGFVLGAVALGGVAVPAVFPYLDARSTLLDAPHPGLSAAAVAGPLLGVIAGMVRGGWAVVMHLSVRAMLAATTPLPARLVPYLDEAVDLGLLRRIGGGYLFPHRTFQDHLAARPAGA